MMYCRYTDDECVYGEQRDDIDICCKEISKCFIYSHGRYDCFTDPRGVENE